MLDFVHQNFWLLAIILNYILVVSALTTIFFKRINPTKTIAYIIVLLLLPYFGLIVYYLFGQEYRKNKIFNRKGVLNDSVVKSINKTLKLNASQYEKLEYKLDAKIKLIKLLKQNDKTPLTVNNNIEIIINGDDKFKLLFEDLRAATKHIHVEYYIIIDDVVGTEFLNILCEKANEGVKVRLSIDDVGSKITSKMKSKLTNSGVEFYSFMPVLFPKFTGRMNYRNHRKIAIIDGEVGYLGGINISDNYLNNNNSKGYWRDTHLRLTGECLFTLQLQFITNWNFVSDSFLDIEDTYFSHPTTSNYLPIQIAASGPDTDWANIMEAIFYAITTAEDYVYIITPYFIPNDQIITAMQVASKSGVDIKLLIPDKSDSWVAKYATNSYIEQLFNANVEVYRYTKGFIHAKTMVVDGVFSTIGTSNMDYRSFNINFEINALVYDTKIGEQMRSQFMKDLDNSIIMDPSSWRHRKTIDKLKEAYSRLWAPLL